MTISFQEALIAKGINEKKAITSLKLSRAGQQRSDRKKFFARSLSDGTPLTHKQRVDLDALSWTTDPALYVAAWCRANNLKP